MYGTLDIRQMMRFKWACVSWSFYLCACAWDKNIVLRPTKIGKVMESKRNFETINLNIVERKYLKQKY